LRARAIFVLIRFDIIDQVDDSMMLVLWKADVHTD